MGCGRRGRDSALAFRLPPAGRETEAQSQRQLPRGAQFARARPVPGPRRPDSSPRSFDHTRRPVAPESRAGSGSLRERSAKDRAGRQTRPTRRQSCLPACPRLSPPRHTFPRALAAALSHPVHLAHTPLAALPPPLSLPRLRLAAAPPRPLAHSHPRPGRAFPAPPHAWPPRRARRGFWRPGAPAPGVDPLPPARREAEAWVAERGARGSAARGGEGALARSLSAAHTPVQTLTQTHAGCAAAARRCSSSRHRLEREREREAERALCPRAAARPGTLPRGGSSAESPPPPLPPGGPGRPRWGEPG